MPNCFKYRHLTESAQPCMAWIFFQCRFRPVRRSTNWARSHEGLPLIGLAEHRHRPAHGVFVRACSEWGLQDWLENVRRRYCCNLVHASQLQLKIAAWKVSALHFTSSSCFAVCWTAWFILVQISLCASELGWAWCTCCWEGENVPYCLFAYGSP